MRINNLFTSVSTSNSKQINRTATTTFSQIIAQAANKNISTSVNSTTMAGQNFHVFLPNEKTIYSGGNVSGSPKTFRQAGEM